jgi:hypothetical protein
MADPCLSDLLTMAFEDTPPWFPLSRRAPMRSHCRKYAKALGCADLSTCTIDQYPKSDAEVRRLLLQGETRIQPTSLKNLCNDVLALLHAAVERHVLPPTFSALHPWRGHDRRATHGRFRRGVYPPGALTRYALIPLPPTLHQELEAYLTWCQNPVARDRSWKIRKRPVTADIRRGEIARIAGYAVHVEELPAELLTLRDLCDPSILGRFADWFLQRRQKSTDGLRDYISAMHTIAKHWLKDPVIDAGIKALFASLPPAEEVGNKEALWLDLEELNLIGESRHPLNPARLRQGTSPWTRWLANHIAHPDLYPLERRFSRTNARRDRTGKPYGFVTLRHMAVWVEVSLMLQLWVRRPLRQRNIRELRLQTNLIPQANGYLMSFTGDELKIGRRGKKINHWEAHFPHALLPLLDEYLTVWRPKIIPSPDFPYLFCNSRGRPYPSAALTEMIKSTTWEYTHDRLGGAVALNPHQIRSLWASQMAIAGLNVIDIARLMGDNLQMVYEKYCLMQQKRVVSQWTKDLAKAIGEGIE